MRHSLNILAVLAAWFSSSAFTNTPTFRGRGSNMKSIKSLEAVSAASTNWQTYTKVQENGEQGSFPFDTNNCVEVCWSRSHYEEAWTLYEKLTKCDDAYVAPKLAEALHCLESAYRLYGPRHVVGSYNGGKDAVVIMHLMRAAHAKHYHDLREREESRSDAPNNDHMHRPSVIYFETKDEFPEVISLLHSTVKRYDLDMVAFDCSHSFKDGLEILVKGAQPQSLSFVLGTRMSDPNGKKQGLFSPSSHYMPPFMRVNPILNWSYGHVWHCLRLFQLPYCSLYDEGYTSLGSVQDTFPCPALARPQGGYWPAYMLSDYDEERAGRVSKKRDDTPSQGKQPTLQPTLSTVSLVSNAKKANGDETVSEVMNYAPSNVSSTESPGSTVGLIIIGDEILKGLCSDTNTYAAATSFRSNGVILSRVVVVPDEHDEIVDEIKKMQKEVDVIVTSGGVGPTHDDVTMRSVSTALSSPLVFNTEMAEILREKMGNKDKEAHELTEAQIKMATIPRNSKLRYLGGTDEWPTVQCRNVYILPGVPQFFEKKITSLSLHLASQFERSITYKVVLSVDETMIVEPLNEVVKRHQHVSIGSYPFVDHPEFKTVVTIEGREAPSHPGDTRTSIRQRSDASFRIMSELKDFPTEPDEEMHESSHNMNATNFGLFTKEEMDLHVKLALADLVSELPDGSILRVNNNDDLT